MQINERLTGIVEEVIKEKPGLFLIELIYKGSPGNSKVVIIVDGDDGVSIDDCAFISRKTSQILEEEDPIEGKYTLEVTSAGTEHPLKLKRQYEKNVGRNVKVLLNDGLETKGLLKGVTKDIIQLEVSKGKKKEMESLDIPFSDIKKTNVLVSFK